MDRTPMKLHRAEFLKRVRRDAGLATIRQAEWLATMFGRPPLVPDRARADELGSQPGRRRIRA